mmetsp:Transcript_795/g.1276  ORF Transcript_795/g.1276 Transcript_795/m.1276 type:complete len:221 (+) Transcript_795:1978-2640(+)
MTHAVGMECSSWDFSRILDGSRRGVVQSHIPPGVRPFSFEKPVAGLGEFLLPHFALGHGILSQRAPRVRVSRHIRCTPIKLLMHAYVMVSRMLTVAWLTRLLIVVCSGTISELVRLLGDHRHFYHSTRDLLDPWLENAFTQRVSAPILANSVAMAVVLDRNLDDVESYTAVPAEIRTLGASRLSAHEVLSALTLPIQTAAPRICTVSRHVPQALHCLLHC